MQYPATIFLPYSPRKLRPCLPTPPCSRRLFRTASQARGREHRHSPNVMGAAGPSHLVSAINSGVAIFNKSTGVKISEVTLQTFFASLNLGPSLHSIKNHLRSVQWPFRHHGRASPYSNPNSWRLIAVSSTSNPTDNWYKWAIDADVNNGTTQTSYWADYNGLGVDNNYITQPRTCSTTSSLRLRQGVGHPKPQLLAGTARSP